MTRSACQSLVLAFSVCWIALPLFAGQGAETKNVPMFERSVRPILKANCFQCHGESDEHKGGLDLRLRRLIAKGGESGPSLVPGKPKQSLILQRISDGEMPPGEDTRKLTAQEISIIRAWITAGAKTDRPEPEEVGKGFLITADDREFWAFQPIRRPQVPQPQHAGRLRTPIDAFLLDRLEERGLSFSADADKRTLIRRVFFDLTGLPPTPNKVQLFLSDRSPDAYERLVDRLLNTPNYGERWGRHWLDVAGYADSEGYNNLDPLRKHAWKYRDYVIQSFNADKPFDRFIQEQLAGDEMLSPPYKNLTADQAEKLIATGFLRMAPDGTGSDGDDVNTARNAVVAETIKIVTTSLLGLTVGCAQCHDHRYDPIPQTDYYSLRAIFEPAYDWKNWRKPQDRLISLYTDADRQQAALVEVEAKKIDQHRSKKQQEYIQRTLDRELEKLPADLRETIRIAYDTPAKKRTPEQQKLLKEHPSINVTAGTLYLYDSKAADKLKKIAAEAAQVRATILKEEFVRALTELPGQVPTTYVFDRGDFEQPKQEVKPAGLTILTSPGSSGDLTIDDPARSTTGRRMAYAKWLTDGSHPLTARVLINRIWMHHFGRGIVPSPGDFGALGERPTHPKLLDWLAQEFMQSGWNLKRLHKLIMTSTAYRQQLRRDPKHDKIDPDNRLLGSMPLRRLEAEAIRDSILAVSGKLNLKPFGPPVSVMTDRVGQFVIGIASTRQGRPGFALPMQDEQFRRSVYVQVIRSRPLAFLDTFDLPRMDPNCEVRARSTVSPQALMLMNNVFAVTQSEHFARRILREAGDDPRAQIAHAWKLAFARQPNEEELSEAATFLAEQTEHFRSVRSKETENNNKEKPSPKNDKEKPPPRIDDDLPRLSIDDVTVDPEGNTGDSSVATFTVTISDPPLGPDNVTVQVSTSNISATAGVAAGAPDFDQLLTTTLTFTPTGPLTQQVQVTINGDNDFEGDETFYVLLFKASPNATIVDQWGVCTIFDDDAANDPRLQALASFCQMLISSNAFLYVD